MTERIDVLGLGAVAVDDLLFLKEFPAPDSKNEILGTERHAGGNTATALVAASRMGRACAYAGTLGSDELSRFALEGLKAEGVSVRHIVRRDGAPPFHSAILVDTGTKTRTILYDSAGVIGAFPTEPPEEVIRSARVLLVDHVGIEGMLRAARIARRAGVPVVADLEREEHSLFRDLLAAIDHLILPYEFARRFTGTADAPSAVRALWAEGRAAVVVTCGAEGSWYLTSEEPGKVFHQPAFRVEVVDTNGCGDVFHGAYAAGLSEGMKAAERIRFAAGVAACKATRPGGQKGIPSRADAVKFLQSRSGEAARLPA
jgi:sulfofructose kinase